MARECEVCGSNVSSVLVEIPITEPTSSNSEQFLSVLRCLNCGFVFNDVGQSQAELDLNYELHSKYSNTSLYFAQPDESAVVADAPWDLLRLSATAAFISERFGTDTPVLDIGSATAALLGFLQRNGFTNLTASDPSRLAINTARKRYRVRGLVGSIFEIGELTQERYGLIVLSHVLEHIRNAKAAIVECLKLLDDSGAVYIEVPDAARYSDFFIAPYHDFNTEHINHFTVASLGNLVKAAGFEVSFVETGECYCSQEDLYPVIRMVVEPSNSDRQHAQASGDTKRDGVEVENGFARYISASQMEIEGIVRRLCELGSASPVVCWGYGQLSYKLIPLLKEHLNIVAVTDGSSEKWGQAVPALGLEVVPPSAVPAGSTIVVLSRHHTSAIVESISGLCPGATVVPIS